MKDTIAIILDLEESITHFYPSFAKERRERREALLKGLYVATPVWDDEGREKWKTKNDIDIIYKEGGYLIVPCSELRELGTKQRVVNNMLEKYPLLEMVDSRFNHKTETARLYLPTDDYAAVLEHYASLDNPRTYVMLKGFNDDMMLNAADVNKNTLKKKSKDAITVSNMSKELLSEQLEGVLPDRDRSRLTYIYGMACSIGFVRQDYVRAPSGRLSSTGAGSLQNINKATREKIFKGFYEVDMVACQWRIAAHLTRDASIKEYSANSSGVRKEIMQDTGMPYDMDSKVKTALISILFGSKRDGTTGPIYDTLGEWGEAFITHPKTTSLIDAVNNLVDDLRKRGHLTKWKAQMSKNKGWRQSLSLLLQHEESKIMDVCRNHIASVDLLLYDGLITSKDVDIDELRQVVRDKTGYSMLFSKRVIGENNE